MIRKFATTAALGVALFAAGTTAALADEANADLLRGVWHMTQLEFGMPGGKLAPVPYQGYVIFTKEGTMSVQSMSPDPNAPDSPYSNHGYEAYFGDYKVTGDGKFVVSIKQAGARGLIGHDFERAFEVSKDKLVLKPTNDKENWRVTYERY